MFSSILIISLSLIGMYSSLRFSSFLPKKLLNYKYLNMNINIGVSQPKYGGIQHCGIIVSNAEKSKNFYINIFGFNDETHMRPITLPYPGAFLRCGQNGDQIHLMELPNPDNDSQRPSYVGRDRHIAFTINNIDVIKERLDAEKLTYSLSSSGRRALFCRDLDGNGFEFVEDSTLN